jgi:hypothetical protein
VQMQLYRWKTPDGLEPLLVAVLNYSFLNANPARCCVAIGEVLLLSSTADRILDTLDQMPNDFTTFTSVRFLDPDGSGADKLMIAADFSGAGITGVDMAIFDVSHRKLNPMISLATLSYTKPNWRTWISTR